MPTVLENTIELNTIHTKPLPSRAILKLLWPRSEETTKVDRLILAQTASHTASPLSHTRPNLRLVTCHERCPPLPLLQKLGPVKRCRRPGPVACRRQGPRPRRGAPSKTLKLSWTAGGDGRGTVRKTQRTVVCRRDRLPQRSTTITSPRRCYRDVPGSELAWLRVRMPRLCSFCHAISASEWVRAAMLGVRRRQMGHLFCSAS